MTRQLLLGVPQLLLLLLLRVTISKAQCADSECNSNETETLTATTTTVTFGSSLNCSFSIGDDASENGSVTGLIPGTVYQIYFSCWNCCTEVTTKPEVVNDLTVTDVTTDSVSLTWTEPIGKSSSYVVQWSDGKDNGTGNTNETSTTIGNLTAQAEYHITVTAVAEDGWTAGKMAAVSQYTRPERVGNLAVTEATASSVSLSWTEPEGRSSSYRVQWTNGTSNWDLSTGKTTLNVTELTAGVLYTFTVIAVAGDDATGSEEAEISLYTKPEAVRNLSVSGTTTSSVCLTWTEPVGSSSFYRVQWANGNSSETVNVTQTSINISDLTAGVQYEVTVTAVAGDGLTGGQSSAVSPFTRPERVGNLAVTEATASSVSLSWTEPEGRSSSYRVQWTNGTSNWDLSTGETTLNVTELTAGVLYTFTVIAVAGDDATGSEEAEISLYTKPEAVRNLNVSGTTTSSVCLTWTEPVGSSSFYRVQWANGNSSETVDVTQTSINISDLTAGVQYEVTVTAVAGDGLTGGQSSAVSPFTRPERVGNLAVTEATASSVSLSWTEPEGRSSSYRVQWTNGTSNWDLSTGETTLNVTELTAGVLYTFTVIAVAGDDATGSEEAEISLYTKPEAVRNLNVSGTTTSSVCLTWTEPVGSSSFYRVQWANGNSSETVNVTQTSINISDLTAGVQYEVTVTAVAGDGLTGGQSSAVSPFTRPGKIGALRVDANTTSIYLSWTPPPGEVFRYKVVWNNSEAHTHEPFAVLSDLVPGTAYAITVFAVAGDNQSGEPHSFTSVTVPAAVGGLHLTDATTSSVSLGWTEPEGGAASYAVQWTAGGVAFNGTTTKTSFTVRHLTPGSQYNITVAAATAHSSSSGETSEISTFTRPEKPENVTVTSRGTDHLTVSWALPEGSSQYFVVNISNEELKYFSSGNTTITAARWTGLPPGRMFVVTVTAVAGAFRDSSDWSAFATFPTPPGSLTVSERTNSSLLLEWATPPGMEAAPHVSYRVTYQPPEGDVLNKSTTANNTELSPLSSGTSYNITVATVGPENLRSTAVHNSSFTLPNPVLNLAASPKSTSSVAVRWSYPLGARSYYKYSVQAFSATGEVFTTTVGTDGTDVPDLEPGSRYRISVRAVAAAGSESMEEEASSYTKPKAVTDLRAEGENTTAVRLTWLRQSDHKPAYSYLVTARRDAMVVQSDSAQTETYTFLNLTPGELYTFDVVTVVGGVKSTVHSTSGYTKPAAASDITLAGNTTSLWASWRPAVGRVDSYAVLLFRGDRLEERHADLSNNTVGQVFPGRKPGTLYCVVVAAQRGTFESKSSRVCNATFPTPPGPVVVEAQTVDAINFTWVHPEDMDRRPYGFIVSSHNGSRLAESNWFLLDRLQSGSLYHISVATVGVWNYTSTAVTADNYTRPYPVTMLPAEITTDSVTLVWKQPESKPHYSYVVSVSNGSTFRSDTVTPTTHTIDGLVAGSNYSFTVTTQTADGTQAAPVTVSYFTQPERVTPRISSQGSNSSILVSWNKPPGEAELYRVHLNGSGSQLEALTAATSWLFEGLSAGRLYSAMVTTHSGPASSASGSVSNATFPNPPGLIDIRTKTNGSIGIQWGAASLMSGASFRYWLTITSPQRGVFVPSSATSHTFTSLLSGTSYNISVATVGVMDLESERVQIHSVTTRPFSVKQLAASTEEESITVAWVRPDEHKEGYRFNVSWWSSGGDGSDVTEESEYRIRGLVPGTPYNLSVTTETSDGTRGAARQIYNCTNASPVTNLTCVGPNQTNAEVVLSWSRPSGQHSSFRVTLNETGAISGTIGCCNHSVSDLRHNSVYELSVETLSCGRASAPASRLCRTGITNPPVPDDDTSLVQVREKVHNRFSLQIDPQLLNDTNGPITHVGVLVTLDLPDDTSDWRSYLGNTYDHWKEKKTPVYLATVVENIFQSRSAENHLRLEVGDGSQWEGYTNGALVTSGIYQYGVVLFTSLSLQNDFVDGEKSLVSRTNFYPAIELTKDPAIPGIAIGATLGIFSFFFIILVGFIIYWRRLSHKESSDIQIHSLRTKVGSVGVSVEEYEDYYRKQKADSNCGFAEEFEDLKVVGTDQSKTNAVTVENKPKNRYHNVLPYDSSRVKLSIVHGSPYDDYINANYIPGYNSRKEFIAAQGPLPATVNEFWRMIWEKNVQTLVMLARCNEQGRVKCEQYWASGTKHFENITVTTTSEIPLEDWTIRDIGIKNVKTAETRSVRQFHFTAWPDHGVPETTELLISFRHLVREHMDQYSRHSPTVVHCSAGVGRTGTFIAIDRLIFQIERDNLVDVYGVVHDMRTHRPLMVQTEDQYVFLNQCAMDIIRSRTGTNVDLIYQNITALSIYENVEPDKNGFHHA